MRICPKCSKCVKDDSWICRDCGAILEQVRVESLPAMADPEVPEPDDNVDASTAPDTTISDEFPLGESTAKSWKCVRCGEIVPGTFDICWNCETSPDGVPGGDSAWTTSENGCVREPESGGQPAMVEDGSFEVPEPAQERDPSAPLGNCPRCGSAKLMTGLTVCDETPHGMEPLHVVVYGNPSALIFKDSVYGPLTAEICGVCGHTSFRVSNPRELYRHFLKSRR